MTTLKRSVKQTAFALAAITVALASVSAQTPPPQSGRQTPDRPAGKAGPRGPDGPGGGLNLQTVQSWVDAWAMVEAQKDLALTDGQSPDFLAKMSRMQSTRRRHMMERQRLLREMGGLAFGGSQRPDDATLTEKLKTFDELTQRSAQEMRQLTQELDAILTPYQRVRFRVFEERIERQKIDMLMRVRAGRGATAPAQPPPKGRGGQ
jgi:Spy/CpxP family protein refolding chaperone